MEVESYEEVRATKETLVATKYRGNNSEIKGTDGVAYLNLKDGQWMYRANGADEDDWYRVDGKNLSCNEDNGFLKCEYTGSNKLFGLSVIGKASFDETENVWIFKPHGAKETFRVGENSLKFIRDKDLTNE